MRVGTKRLTRTLGYLVEPGGVRPSGVRYHTKGLQPSRTIRNETVLTMLVAVGKEAAKALYQLNSLGELHFTSRTGCSRQRNAE